MKLWSFKTPTEPGLYLVNYGDVVTEKTLSMSEVRHSGKDLVDQSGQLIFLYRPSYKWLKVETDELNKLGNEI